MTRPMSKVIHAAVASIGAMLMLAVATGPFTFDTAPLAATLPNA